MAKARYQFEFLYGQIAYHRTEPCTRNRLFHPIGRITQGVGFKPIF